MPVSRCSTLPWFSVRAGPLILRDRRATEGQQARARHVVHPPAIALALLLRRVYRIAGNRYRVVTAIHLHTQLVYVLQFLTHAAYSRDPWKEV